MQNTTLCLLLQNNPATEVLLGYKKTGFGRDKYTGFGGKVEPGEQVAAAALRELAEESGVSVPAGADFELAAILEFHFPHKPGWSQRVHVFTTHQWMGVPTESREMIPRWFAVDAIPYEQMWDDARYWLPRILKGETFRAEFIFHANSDTIATVSYFALSEA